MSQVLIIKNKGLHTAPNEFSAVPEGAMLQADNCSVDTDGIVEPRRGFDRYIAFAGGSDRARRYAFYNSTQIAAYSNGKVARYNAGTWTDYTGTFNDPDSSFAHLKFLKASANLYFTSAAGVQRLDSVSGTPVLAGVPKGLDLQLTLSTGTAFAVNNQYGYRMVWGFKDANGTIFTSAPSGRTVITNPSTGTTKNITVRFTIPSSITTSYFYQVYRTSGSLSENVDPGEEFGLVYENNPAAGDITAGYVEFIDSTPDTLRGATLYTSPSQEGILQSNERPPLCQDITAFSNSVFYANCTSKYRKTFTILSTVNIAMNDTLTIAGVVYTAKGTETIASGQYSLSSVNTTTGTTVNLSNVLTGVASTAGCRIGWKISGTNIPANTYIGSFTSSTITMVQSDGATAQNATAGAGGVTFTFTPNIFAFSSTSSTAAQNIADTANSLIRVINRYASNTLVYATLLSGVSDLPGQILLEERGLGGSAFTIQASANGTSFNPVLTTAQSASNDNFKHQLFYSKTDKPEAVPLLNYKFVGSANNAIRRIIPLGNSLFVLKEQEGIYRVTGNSPSTFDVQLFDSSARLLAPDSVDVVNNQIWCLTDQGVCVITETGVSVISRPIEDYILGPTGTALTQVKTYSHGVGYETDRKYILWTPSNSADTFATQAFIWNTFTRAFTRWDIPATTAAVSPDDGKLYIGRGDNTYTLQERKTLTYADYVDHSISVTISAHSGTSITLSSVSGVEVGDILYQSSSLSSLITAINGSVVTTADNLAGWANSSASVLKSYTSTLAWTAITGQNPGTSKQWPEIAMLFRAARFNSATVSFATDFSGSYEEVPFTGNRVGLWGLFPWGQSPWGSSATAVAIRTYVPLEKQRGSLLRVRFSIKQGYSAWKLNGISVPFRDTGSFFVAK